MSEETQEQNTKVMFYSLVELYLSSEEIDSSTEINNFIAAESAEFKSQSYSTYRQCLDDSIGFLNSKKTVWEDKFGTEYKIYALENPNYSKNRGERFPTEDTYWDEDMMVSIVLVNDQQPKDPWIIRVTIKAFEIEMEKPTFYIQSNGTVH